MKGGGGGGEEGTARLLRPTSGTNYFPGGNLPLTNKSGEGGGPEFAPFLIVFVVVWVSDVWGLALGSLCCRPIKKSSLTARPCVQGRKPATTRTRRKSYGYWFTDVFISHLILVGVFCFSALKTTQRRNRENCLIFF